MISFAYPWLLLLLLIPAMVMLRRRSWGQPPTLLYPEAAAAKAAFRGGRRPGSGPREWSRLLLLAVLILAAARPQQKAAVAYYQTSGLDIMLALDISGSMSARDFDPLNRLQAAKAALRRFLSEARQDRIGMVAFAARAYQVCPLTVDYQVLNLLMDHLQIGMTTDGTAIGMALTSAINRLRNTRAKSKVIILLTDGNNNAGSLDPLTAAEIAAALHIKIYTIGVGREGGAPIMVKDATGAEKVLLNPDGSVHYEELDETTLQKIAAMTGGAYYRAENQDKLASIYQEISSLERTALQAKNFRAHKDIGFWFLIVAAALFVADVALMLTLDKRFP